MKVFANGFNLYGQLIKTKNLIEGFDVVYESEVIKNFGLNYSFSYFLTKDSLLMFPKTKKEIIIDTTKIIKIASNDERIIGLYDDGRLAKLDYDEVLTMKNVPKLWDTELDCDNIVNVSCGSKIDVFYSKKGQLFTTTRKLKFEKDNVAQIECGREHCLLLDETGNVYSFGRGR